MNTNFIDKYMALKMQEKDALNSLLERFPNKQFDLEENDCSIGVDYYINDEPHHADVKKVVYPVTQTRGIFVEDDYTEKTVQIGYSNMGFGEIGEIINYLPDPSVETLNEQCKRILDKVSEATKYDKEELEVRVNYDDYGQPKYSIDYDEGILETAHDMTYEETQHYLDGVEFALDMWLSED